MDDIKYLGVQGLEELIILTQNALAKKADVLQFDAMPDPTKYIGKIVQYVGISDISFTRSHFYYSNGIRWAEEIVSGEQPPKIKMVTALPSWVDSDPQVLYILKNTADIAMNFYVKNPSVNDTWFTVEKSVSFVVVASLPQWADADSSIIYFKADGNALVGYIKNTSTTNAWYAFGEKPQTDTAISATSPNPLQNKVIFTEVQRLHDADKELHDGIEANSNALSSLGTEVGGIHYDIAANSTAISHLGTEVQGLHNDITACQDADKELHDDITACQDADKKLRNDIGINSTAISRHGGEIRDLHDAITACQDTDKQLRKDIDANSTSISLIVQTTQDLHAENVANSNDIAANSTAISRLGTEVQGLHDTDKQLRNDTNANSTAISRINGEIQDLCKESDIHQYVQNQNLLSDFEDITISGVSSAPTRMKYDGYVTVIENGTDQGVKLYINNKNAVCASRHNAVTVFVAKNDNLHLMNPSTSGTVAYARFYKLRDYTGR